MLGQKSNNPNLKGGEQKKRHRKSNAKNVFVGGEKKYITKRVEKYLSVPKMASPEARIFFSKYLTGPGGTESGL